MTINGSNPQADFFTRSFAKTLFVKSRNVRIQKFVAAAGSDVEISSVNRKRDLENERNDVNSDDLLAHGKCGKGQSRNVRP